MREDRRQITIFTAIVLIIFAATSCNLPIRSTPTVTTPPPIPAFTTQPPPETASPAATEAPQEAESPTSTPDTVEIQPVAGSILRWVDYSDFIYVPAGEYTIGEDSTIPSDHAPAHQVNLSGFWIHQAEVTNQQYTQCVADGKCSAPNKELDVPYWYNNPYKGNYPVVGVTWYQAQEYCTYIDARLPSEAEWEATSRGFEAKPYPWGTDQPNCDLLNYDDCLDPSEPDEIRSYNNGTSDFDAMDMSGNVFEWVNDWYEDDYYATSPSDNPIGPEEGIKKVYRGGAYDSIINDINAIARFETEPKNHAANLGFRCVLIGPSDTNIGQPCSVTGNNGQLENQPTYTPYPCSPASVSAYCQLQGSKPVFAIKIQQSNCLGNMLHSLTGNSNPLDCTVSQLAGGGNQFLCTSPGLAQGALVDVSYCHVFNAQLQTISCPVGYVLDQATLLCELEDPKLPEPPCPKGYLDVPPNGCMPVYDPNNGDCPVGYYHQTMPLISVCVPYNDCLLSNAPTTCQTSSCSAGQKYNTARGCCESDQPHPFCAGNLLYNADQKVCIGSDIYPNDCPVVQVKIPYCPTVTPSPTPTTVVYTKCRKYTDSKTCFANGCNWVTLPSGAHACR